MYWGIIDKYKHFYMKGRVFFYCLDKYQKSFLF